MGGGIVSALINWARANRADQKDRKIKYLDDQIRKLYGPLYYLILQSEKLFEINKKFHEAYSQEYCEQKWSQNEHTQKVLKEETSTTIDLANQYIKMVEDNNEKIKELLDSNSSLLDPEDIDTMMVFFEHHTRCNTERDGEGRLTTPFRIYHRVGNISFLRPEIIEKIKSKFLYKKEELEKLLK